MSASRHPWQIAAMHAMLVIIGKPLALSDSEVFIERVLDFFPEDDEPDFEDFSLRSMKLEEFANADAEFIWSLFRNSVRLWGYRNSVDASPRDYPPALPQILSEIDYKDSDSTFHCSDSDESSESISGSISLDEERIFSSSSS